MSKLAIVSGLIIKKNEKVLLIKEPTSKGLLWNQPMGKMEENENIFEAAIREAKEETGLNVNLTGFLGCYYFTNHKQEQRVRFCFIGEGEGELKTEDGSVTKWFTNEELTSLNEEDFRSKSAWQITQDWLKQKIYPIDLIKLL